MASHPAALPNLRGELWSDSTLCARALRIVLLVASAAWVAQSAPTAGGRVCGVRAILRPRAGLMPVVLHAGTAGGKAGGVNPDEIADITADVFNVPYAALLGASRVTRIAEARYALAWALRTKGWSLEEIGEYLHRDHTTIMYGLKQIERKQPKQLVELERRMGMQVRPTIVCLCGSTRFYKDFLEQNYRETMAGRIVLSVGFYPHAAAEMHGEGVGITPEQKQALDELHMRKIDLCDEILVINIGGYIGQSTAREIAYARKFGKAVRFLQAER